MRLLGGFSRAGAVRLTGVLVAAVAVVACCVGVSSAAAGGVIRTIPVGSHPEGVAAYGGTPGSLTPSKIRSARSKHRAA